MRSEVISQGEEPALWFSAPPPAPHPQLKCDECQWPPVTSSQSLEVSGTVSAAQRLLTQGSWEAAGPMQQTLKHNAVCVWPTVSLQFMCVAYLALKKQYNEKQHSVCTHRARQSHIFAHCGAGDFFSNYFACFNLMGSPFNLFGFNWNKCAIKSCCLCFNFPLEL